MILPRPLHKLCSIFPNHLRENWCHRARMRACGTVGGRIQMVFRETPCVYGALYQCMRPCMHRMRAPWAFIYCASTAIRIGMNENHNTARLRFRISRQRVYPGQRTTPPWAGCCRGAPCHDHRVVNEGPAAQRKPSPRSLGGGCAKSEDHKQSEAHSQSEEH